MRWLNRSDGNVRRTSTAIGQKAVTQYDVAADRLWPNAVSDGTTCGRQLPTRSGHPLFSKAVIASKSILLARKICSTPFRCRFKDGHSQDARGWRHPMGGLPSRQTNPLRALGGNWGERWRFDLRKHD